MKTLRVLAINAVIAALYIVLIFLLQPISFLTAQFRIAEIFNHLVVFDKKYFWGIVGGVLISNAFFSPMLPYDLIVGTGQSVLALLLTIFASRYVHHQIARMLINTAVFTVTMFLIAWELAIVNHFPFLWTWLTVAAEECAVMLVGIPIMYALGRRVPFAKIMR